MSIGSVSTPTATSRSPRTERSQGTPTDAGPEQPTESKPDLPPGVETGRRALSRVRSQLPSIPNSDVLVAAVTGHANLSSEDGAAALYAAQHGDAQTSSRRSSRSLRRDGTHVGARDARIAELEVKRSDARAASATATGPAASGIVGEVNDEIRLERGLNAVADTLHVVGADEAVVDVIEDADAVTIIPDSELFASAAYDASSGSILISRSTAEKVAVATDRLVAKGILDDRGRIVAGREDELDNVHEGDLLIKIGTLLGVHEATHRDQHDHGSSDEVAQEVAEAALENQDAWMRAMADGLPMVGEPFDVGNGAWDAERIRVDGEEYEAYHAQELADLELGAALQIKLTTDNDGTPLPREQAVDNIVALERGVPLPYGPDAGWLRNDVRDEILENRNIVRGSVPWSTSDLISGATIHTESPGWKRPGEETPGWKRPGVDTV